MSKLEEWEALAQKNMENNIQMMMRTTQTDYHRIDQERILALIDLIRKKDEALRLVLNAPMDLPQDPKGLLHCKQIADKAVKALALTEELK